jgi:hypothetical protein
VIPQLFVLGALTGLVCLIALAFWAFALAWRNIRPTRDWQLGLLGTELVLATHLVALLLLWAQGALREPLTTAAYTIIAMASVPSLRAYLPDDAPRQYSSLTALTCLFAVGMLIRALQTAFQTVLQTNPSRF